MTEIKNELAVATATEQAQVDAIVEQMQSQPFPRSSRY